MGTGYTIPNPETVVVKWTASTRGDRWDALQPIPFFRHLCLSETDQFKRYGASQFGLSDGVPLTVEGLTIIDGVPTMAAKDQAGYNGPQIVCAGHAGEGIGSVTAAAYEELRRRYGVNPTAQEVMDLCIAEAGGDTVPSWMKVPTPQVDPCASVKSQLAGAQSQITTLQEQLASTGGRAAHYSSVIDDVRSALGGIRITSSGGGAPMSILRKIQKIVS